MYDPAAVRFYDIAHEGAHIRAISSFLTDGGFADLDGLAPRSLVVVARDDMSRLAAEVGVGLLRASFAITIVAELPEYVGPLDIVVVVSTAGADAKAEFALSTAASRGCPVFLVAPPNCPLAEDASTRVTVLPGLPTTAAASPCRIIATLVGLVCVVQQGARCGAEELELLAQHVDDELARVSPDRDASINEAQLLLDFVAGARVIATGGDEACEPLARLIAGWWTAHGLVCAHLSKPELAHAGENLWGEAPDIFYDRFEEDAPAVLPLKIVVWGAADAGLPHAIAQHCAPAAAGGKESLLRLLVRGMAVTALQ